MVFLFHLTLKRILRPILTARRGILRYLRITGHETHTRINGRGGHEGEVLEIHIHVRKTSPLLAARQSSIDRISIEVQVLSHSGCSWIRSWWRYLLFEGLAAHLHGEADVHNADGASLAGQLHIRIVHNLVKIVDHATDHRRGWKIAASCWRGLCE